MWEWTPTAQSKQPECSPPGRNSELVIGLLDSCNLAVLNWGPSSTGFATRIRGPSSSQLDLFLGCSLTQSMVSSLRIRESLSFGSDHRVVDLSLNIISCPPPALKTLPKKVYAWTPAKEKIFAENLKPKIQEWMEDAQQIRIRSRCNNQNVEDVSRVTKSLTSIIVDTCDHSVESKLILPKSSRPSQRGFPEVRQAVRMRDDLISLVNVLRSRQPVDVEALSEAKRLLKEAGRNLQSKLLELNKENLERTWSKLSSSFPEDRTTPHKPLPKSLVINNQDIRDPAKIIAKYVDRFTPPPPKSSSQANTDFQKRIVEKVNSFAGVTKYDLGGSAFIPKINGNITEVETGDALTKSSVGKSPNDDKVLNEMLKKARDVLLPALTLLCNIIWLLEVVSPDWKLTLLCPVYKKKSRFDPINYRPIALLSNLYKLFERILDARIRSIIHLPPEQCGFRPGYSTDTQLLRLHVLFEYCKNLKIPLFVGFLDFEQAFERAWRPGVLYQLWVAGVKGKCWRLVSHLLRNVFAKVRTNFGDSDLFRLDCGVLQGSVLAAILFIVFVNPLVGVLRQHCDSLNGLTLTPQLFADDLLLLGLAQASRLNLIAVTLAWADRWNASVQDKKSGLLTTCSDRPNSVSVCSKVFKEQTQVIHLGMGINREGVFTTAYVHSKVTRVLKRLQLLCNSGVRLGAIRADACVFLFNQCCLSLAKHALALCPANSKRLSLLGKVQTSFANSFLGLPEDTPSCVGMAELGLLDLPLQADRLKILLVHRVLSNPSDSTTRALLNWPLDPEGTSFLSSCSSSLSRMGSPSSLPLALATPYRQLSSSLLECSKRAQASSWITSSERHAAKTYAHHLSKLVWGFDRILLLRDGRLSSALIKMRAGCFTPPSCLSSLGLPTCELCLAHPPSLPLLLWDCPCSSSARSAFLSRVNYYSPHLRAALVDCSPQEATHLVLGAAAALVPESSWDLIQPLCAQFCLELSLLRHVQEHQD